MSQAIEEWMTDVSACSKIVSGDRPILDIASLRELRSFLDTQPLQCGEDSRKPLAQDQELQGREDVQPEPTTETRSERGRSMGEADGGREGRVHSGADASSRRHLGGNRKGAR